MLIPSSALADENNYVIVNEGEPLSKHVWYLNDGSAGTAGNYNYHFDEDNHTLYLRNLDLTYEGIREAFQIVYQRDAAFTVHIEGICTINAANARAFGLILGEAVDSITFEGDGRLRVNGHTLLRANQGSSDPKANIIFDGIALNFNITNKVFGGNISLTMKDVDLTLTNNSLDVPAQALYSKWDMTIESSVIEATVTNPGGELSGFYSEKGSINISDSNIEMKMTSGSSGVVAGILAEEASIDISASTFIDLDIDIAGATQITGVLTSGTLSMDSSELVLTMRGDNSTWDTFSHISCTDIELNDSTLNIVGSESLENKPKNAIYTASSVNITGASDLSIDDVNFEMGIFAIDSIDINLTKGGRVFVRTAMPADFNYIGIYSQTGDINLASGSKITTPAGGRVKTLQEATTAHYIAGVLDPNNGGYVIEIKASTTPANPATGENCFVFIGIALALAAGFGIVLTKKKQQA